ncbi:MAG TPA: FAD-dependent oxidoreductase [Alphaproteobacteria bacterium]|nr:FAD-dependent oxidoreductase [Alphaproteobacteria bacterium]
MAKSATTATKSEESGQTNLSADVIVIGSGAAALSAALVASVGGADVLIFEKSEKIGGTTAMSGAGTWVPANHHARAAGIDDSAEETLRYLRAASPEGWQETENHLWESFVHQAPSMLEFLERHTPLRFELIDEPDPQAEKTGGKVKGRMLSPLPLSRWLVGPAYAHKIRRSTLPHLFTYAEIKEYDPYGHPVTAVLRLAPILLARVLTNRAGQGNSLVVGLLRGCLDHGCRLELACRVTGLIVDPVSGHVDGVEVDRGGKPERCFARRGVVLATGGFEWDRGRYAQHFPGPLDWILSPSTNTGDGQRMAEEVGAAVDRMDQANVFPALPTVYEGKLHGIPIPFQLHPHCIVVDRLGRRFVSEFDYNIGEAIDRRDPKSGQPLHLPCWLVGDSRFIYSWTVFRWYARHRKDWMRRAATIEDLAAKIDVPASALAETLARYNGFVAAGRDADFHRGESAWERYKSGSIDSGRNLALGAVDRPPFIAWPLNRSIVGTKGGARTNEHGQVLRPDGSVITGLYCAGNAMANPIGTRAVGAGTTIGPCLTWGYICGKQLLKENR